MQGRTSSSARLAPFGSLGAQRRRHPTGPAGKRWDPAEQNRVPKGTALPANDPAETYLGGTRLIRINDYVRARRREVRYRTTKPSTSTMPSSRVDQTCRESNCTRTGSLAGRLEISPAASRSASIRGMILNCEIAVKTS